MSNELQIYRKRLIPDDEYENVFFNNALRVFPKISRLL